MLQPPAHSAEQRQENEYEREKQKKKSEVERERNQNDSERVRHVYGTFGKKKIEREREKATESMCNMCVYT